MKLFLTGLCAISLGVLPGAAAEAKKDAAEETRAKYAKQPADALRVVEPVKVKDVFYWKDGGSIGIVLTDAKGEEHAFCLDGRLSEDPKGKGTRNLFVGATHPTRPGAKMVAPRGPEESALYGVMLRWVAKHPQRAAFYDENVELDRKAVGKLWETRAFFRRLDARFVGQ